MARQRLTVNTRDCRTSFDSIFQNLMEPMLICDSDLRVTEVNRAFSELFNDQAVGKKCHEVFQGPGAEHVRSRLEEVIRTKESRSFDLSALLPNGKMGHFEFMASPLWNSEQTITGIIGQVHDISKRKSLEKELHVSEERYRKIVETAREGIYIVDNTGNIRFANRRLASMLGGSVEEIIGRSVFDFMDESARALALSKFERRRQGLSDTYELTMTRTDGRRINCLVSAAPMMRDGIFEGVLGVLTNVTCLKEIEAALRSAKTFSEKIINSITDRIVVVEPLTYRIVQVNESFLIKTGAGSSSELTDRTCHEVLFGSQTPCHEEGIFCPVRKTFETGKPFLCDTVHPDLGERERIIQIATYPILNERDEVELVIRTERDITEKKMLEQALALRSEELVRTQGRLEELFDLSREVGMKSTLPELVQFLVEFTTKLLPGAEPALFLLNAARDQLLQLDGCAPHVVERLSHFLQKIELCGLTSDFVHQLEKFKTKKVVTADNAQAFPLLKILTEADLTWFAIPLFVRWQCIGLLFLGWKTFNKYPAGDLRFLEALYEQASGHLRNLVVHEAEVSQLKSQVAERTSYGDMIGQSKAMQEIYELIDLVAGSDATVLITGENGTGKEVVAHSIHRQSHRRKGPFIVANCSAYSPTLLESEIFGHEKGAFTGATHQKKGRIERAHGGTLFLDEIGEIAPSVQIFLLRFLQDHCFERVGGEKVIAADVRVLAATNRNLQQAVEAGKFRDDLYYRLNVIAVHLPSLRERKEDIPLLAQHFLGKYNLKERKNIKSFSIGAMQAMMNYSWPGNVRQLENAISYAVVLTQGDLIRRKHLPRFLWEIAGGRSVTSLSENERFMVLNALRKSNWNKHDAARRLNISRSTLYSKMRRYGLEDAAKCAD